MGTVGLGLNQPPVLLLNTMNSFSEKYVLPILGDVTFIPSPSFWAMTRHGKKFHGAELVYGLITQEEMTGGAYWGAQLLDTAVTDSITPADQLWRFYRQSMTIPITDLVLNRGGSNAIDLVAAKFQVSSGSFLQKLVRALWGSAPQNTSLDVDNIPNWVNATTNTIAGINRATAANSFWLPAAAVPAGGQALNPVIAETAYQSVVYGYDEPDLLIMPNKQYGDFKSNFTQNIRFTNEDQDNEAVQAGFRYHFMFNNAITLADLNVPANTAFLLNTKYIFPVFHEQDYFTIDPWVKPSNQRVAVSTQYLTWQVVCLGPKYQVAITALA